MKPLCPQPNENRSRTFEGVAEACAAQWAPDAGEHVLMRAAE